MRDITQIKQVVDLPVIGIIKKDYPGTPMYITVTMKEVDELEMCIRDRAKIEAARTFIDFIAADPDQVKDSVLASTYFPVRTSCLLYTSRCV